MVGDRGGPELIVEKDGLNPRPVAGQPGWFDADFAVTLSNPSVETLWNVEFIDDFASGLCSGAWTGCTLAADPVGTNITLKSAFVINLIGGVWTETAQSIPAGGEARVDYTVRFQANGDLGPYTNIVTVTGEESLGNRTISAEGREAAIILLDSPGVTVDKELISTQVMGQNAFRSVFTLQVTNGSEVLTDVDLLDDLATGWAAATTTAEITDITLLVQDPGATWVLATPPTSGATALVAETASWPADDSATFQITVDYTVANGATGDLPITNIATITGLNAASIAETSTDAVTISADQLTGDRGDAQLVIDKDAGIVRKASDSDPALSAFFDVDFTVTFTNPSDETAFNLVLVDDLPTTLGAGPWNSFEVQTIAATGVTTQTAATINGDFTANWLMPNQDLAPGASATVTFTVRFHSGVAPMQSGDLGPYTNVATITAEDALGDRNIQAVSQTDVQILLDNPSAHIDKEIYRTEVIDQNTFITTFRLQATNGAEPLTNAVISDDLNDIFYNGWAAAHDTSLINDPDVVVMNTAILVEDTPTGQWTTSTDPAALATIALWPANDSITLEIQVRYTVRPDDGLSGAADTDGGDAGELPISNIARITGTDPAGNPVVSEDAVSLTADQLRGDRGGPQLVIDKDGGVVRPAANGAIGFFDVDFTVSITNPSDETAWNLALIDDLNTSMGTGDWDNFSVVDITATGVTPQSSLLINFNEASWATYNWLAPGQHLAAGATARVNYTVRFELVDDFDANTPQFGPYTNLVTLTAEDALGTPAPSVADAFDRAIVVTATEDAQIFLDAPGIEIDKEHVATQMTSQQNFTSIFTLQVINGSEDLANATLNDDLLTGWAAAVAGTVQVTAIDVVADNSGGAWTPTTTPITGGAITASTQLASTTLVPADSATTFRIEVAYQTTAATQANLPIRNTATLQGQSPAGDDLIVADYAEVLELELTGDKVAALDIKKSLARPVFQILVEDPDMVPTVQPLLTGGQPTYQADFVLYAENRGQQILHMVQISDDLIATFGAGNIVSVSTPVISGDLSLAATPAFDGQGNNDLLAGTEELDVGEDTTVTFSVQFTASSPISSLTNTAVLTAQDMFGNVLTDDDDVPLGVPALDITKTVIALDDSDSANDNYTVTFSLTATNIGNINLTNVQISDDFQSQLTLLTGGVGSVDTTQVDVVAASISTTGTGTFGDNNLFKANIQNPFLFGGASNLRALDVGQSVTAEIIIAFNSGGFQGLIDNVAVVGADSDGDVTRDVFAIDDEAINIGGTAAIWRATIDKAFIGPAVNTSGTLFEVPFEIEIANTGTRELDNVQLLDDIAAQLLAQHGPAITLNSIKPGTLSLDATNAIGSTLTLNTGYTGASPNHNLLTNNPTAVFQPGDTYVFAFTAIVDNTGFVADFDNEANLIASRRQSPDQGQEPWIDITDRVNVPLLMPDLTIMKLVESNQQVSGTTHDVIFYVLITNSGNAPLSVANGLSLKDDLATQMTNQGATLTSVTVPMLTPLNTNTGGSALILNPSFDAGLTAGNDEALASGTLEVGDGYELRFRARIEVPATLGQVTNTAVTEAQGVDPKDASAIVLLAQPDPNTFLITKRADRTTASVGDIILYTLTGLNQLNLERKIDIVDTLPVGFTYVAGSATYNGVADEPTIVGQVLTWEDKIIDAANDADPAAVKGYTIIFAALVTPAAQPGDYVNRHQIFDPYSGLPLSPVAIATVRVIADPTFDCSDIIGRVFNDLNRDGYPDPGEPGIAAARVVTVNGLSITADAHGRFHVACGAIPDSLRGSNFIMKLDERSLPAGYRITSENPRVVRLTRGKVTKVNFGASISQVYRIDLDDQAFVPSQIKLNDAYRPALMQLIDQLAQSNSVLRITYHTRFGKSALTQARVNAIAKFVRAKVTAKGTGHSLKIEPEIIRALGSSKAIQPKVQQQTITKKTTTTYIQPKGQLSNTQGATQVPQSEWQGKYVVPKGYILMRRQDGKLFLRKTN